MGDYKDSRTLVEYQCECGNIAYIRLDGLLAGKRCNNCGNKKRSKSLASSKHYMWITDRDEAKRREIFRKKCGSMLRNCLRNLGQVKEKKTHEILGYSAIDWQNHIENHPNWTRVKNGKWHTDHIFPVKAFVDYGIYDLKLMNCLENLQPLSQEENLKKHDNYDKSEFKAWLKIKGYNLSSLV